MTDRSSDKRLEKWSKAIKKKYSYVCQICFKSDVYLNSHHLNAYNAFPNERYDILNGICLCQDCHNQFHIFFGKGGNTKRQFIEFSELIKLIRKLAKDNVRKKLAEGQQDGYK